MDKKVLSIINSLYAGKDTVQKHIRLVIVVTIPALILAFFGLLKGFDIKVTESSLGSLYLIAFLAVIPCVLTVAGFYAQQVQRLLCGVKGMPEITLDSFIIGFRQILFMFCWMMYSVILLAVPVVIIWSSFNNTGFLGIFIAFILTLVLVLILSIVLMLIYPNMIYIYIEYVKSSFTKAACLNPLYIFKFYKKGVKKSFKVLGVMILLSLLLNTIWGTVGAMFTGITFALSKMAKVIVMIPLTIAQAYIGCVLSLIGFELFVDVYKEEFNE